MPFVENLDGIIQSSLKFQKLDSNVQIENDLVTMETRRQGAKYSTFVSWMEEVTVSSVPTEQSFPKGTLSVSGGGNMIVHKPKRTGLLTQTFGKDGERKAVTVDKPGNRDKVEKLVDHLFQMTPALTQL